MSWWRLDVHAASRSQTARAALERAGRAAHHARIPALSAEVESAVATLNAPAARLIANGNERLLRLDEVESLIKSKALVIDACRHLVRNGRAVVPLASRPVLFALVRALGEAWPGDVTRECCCRGPSARESPTNRIGRD